MTKTRSLCGRAVLTAHPHSIEIPRRYAGYTYIPGGTQVQSYLLQGRHDPSASENEPKSLSQRSTNRKLSRRWPTSGAGQASHTARSTALLTSRPAETPSSSTRKLSQGYRCLSTDPPCLCGHISLACHNGGPQCLGSRQGPACRFYCRLRADLGGVAAPFNAE